jgi:glycosyltransferase involved in cell wall biosynthesis
MFVFNNCANDARVLKESATLAKLGYDVEILALLDKKTAPEEYRDGVRILRLQLNPWNLRLIKAFSNPFRYRPRRRRSKKSDGTIRKANSIARWTKVWQRKLKNEAFEVISDRPSNVRSAREVISRNVWRIVKQKPSLALKGVFFFAINAVIGVVRRVMVVIRRRYLKARRWVKLNGISFSKGVIQPVLKRVLFPPHRYFVYYDFYRRARDYSLKNPAEIYHCHDLNTLFIGIKLKEIQGAKLVYDSHELYLHKNRLIRPSHLKTGILRYIERKGFKAADSVITVGDCIADWLAREYQAKRPEVILNAPRKKQEEDQQLDGVSLRSTLNIPEDYFLLIYSGGITFNRGLENVIKAVKEIPRIHFVMLGYGTEAYVGSLRDLIHRLGARSKVSFFGPVPHHEVASYLSTADCGIAPILNICLSYYYCSPNKLFEYVQARLPVIASNFPEMEKVVMENNIGFTFDPEDVSSIVASIEKMRENPSNRALFKENTKMAAERYNWAVEEEKLQQIYTSLTA